MDVTFAFDPACPWTWLTARWLVKIATLDDVTVTWQPFSLLHLNGVDDATAVEGDGRDAAVASAGALRVVQSLAAAGDQEGIGRFYEVLGTRWHRERAERSVEVVLAAAAEAGVDAAAAVGDASLDAAIHAATDDALCLAGPDIGSPVLSVGPDCFSLHGPLVDKVPDEESALRIWQAVLLLSQVDEFHELKRGRRGRPDLTGG